MTCVHIDSDNNVTCLQGKMSDGTPVNLRVAAGKIAAMETRKLADGDGVDDDVILCPGFIDLQVNGFAGIDLNSDEVSASDVVQLVEALWRTGVTSFLPTIVTGSSARLQKAMTAVREAFESSETVRNAVLGIHLEGPYLSGEDGPRGAHNVRFIRDPDLTEFETLHRLSGHLIRMVTLAPERNGAIPFIQRVAAQGVVVAIGHTAATEEQIEHAVTAGARMSTHLGNGSHPLLPRHQSYLWAQLADDRLWAGMIADGQHLPPSVLKTFLRAKRGKVALVSDAVHLAGRPPGVYKTNTGGEVELLPNGRLQLCTDARILAGAATGIDTGVQTVLRYSDLALADAVGLVTENPARILGEETRGQLSSGLRADFTLALFRHSEHRFRIVGTVASGRLVYRDPLLQVKLV